MTSWTVGQLLEATHGELLCGELRTPVEGIGLDSRRLEPHEAFVAIRGARFDAHTFIPEAINRGAACLIVSQVPDTLPPIPTILVRETTQALGAIARCHRMRFHIPVIAVTGSCGKTTTKELIAHLLSASSKTASDQVLKTRGTENNHIGLPLTLLGMSPAHEFAVVELGSNHPGEIAYLADIARPTVALITNVGPAHLEFFGSLVEVLCEKLSLLKTLGPGGLAILPGDQLDVLIEAKLLLPTQAATMTFGTSDRCTLQAYDIRRRGMGWSMRMRDVRGEFLVPLPGSHNVENALGALACVKALGLSLESVQERLSSFEPLPMRSEVVRANGVMIVNDCYNANPLSFARALEVLRDLEVRRRVVVAGDMLELGRFSQAAHQAIGRMCAQVGIDVIVAVGTYAPDVVKGAGLAHHRTLTCRTVQELHSLLPSILQDGDGVLIKGSRNLHLEQVTEFLLSNFAPQNCLSGI